MSNDPTTAGRSRRALPTLVLGLMVAGFFLVSGAQAEDPPIVSVGQVTAGGNAGSGSVGSDGQANACVNDESSKANPTTPDMNLNEGTCQAATGSSAGSGSSRSTGSAGSTGAAGSTAAGRSRTSGSTSAAWVSAGQALGLRIVRVRHLTRKVNLTNRFRVLVTLRDARGKLVRGAIVSVSRAPGAQSTISDMYATYSNKVGQASIGVAVSNRMLGKRLYLKIAARTPSARSMTLRSVRLPAVR
jgi:hypothetical protein